MKEVYPDEAFIACARHRHRIIPCAHGNCEYCCNGCYQYELERWKKKERALRPTPPNSLVDDITD